MTERIKLADTDLLYAATARCRCGAGLAYPLDHEKAMAVRAWVCSRVLKCEVEEKAHRLVPFGLDGDKHPESESQHDAFDWMFYKVREETSVNNHGAYTTRPAGTICRTIGKATCPKCKHEWESEPHDAPTLGHYRHSGPCPQCTYAVGSEGSYSSPDIPIDVRYRDIVLPAEKP